MNEMYDYDIVSQPKRGLGYHVAFSTHRVRPVTGREWLFHIDDEQMALLREIELMFARMEGANYSYTFREIHRKNDAGEWFDGWGVIVRGKKSKLDQRAEFEGFPESYSEVLSALRLAYIYLRNMEDELDV